MRDKLPDLRRRLFNILWAVSLLLCGAVCVLWVRSYGLSDRVMWMTSYNAGHLYSAKGRAILYFDRTDWRGARNSYLWPFEGHGIRHVTLRADGGEDAVIGMRLLGDQGNWRTSWRRGGFGLYARSKRNGDLLVNAVAPFWAIALLTALPALLALMRKYFRRIRARRRITRGLCAACGYDRRATPVNAPCPECGFVPDSISPRKEWSIMRRAQIFGSFAAGFVAATLIAILIIVPIEKQRVRDRLHDEVYSPMKMGMYFSTVTLARGQSQRAIEQLDTLVEKFNFYENFGGSPPKDWYYQLFDRSVATKPAK